MYNILPRNLTARTKGQFYANREGSIVLNVQRCKRKKYKNSAILYL